MGEWLAVHILIVLACARATRVVTTDSITAPMRAHLDAQANPDSHTSGSWRWLLLWELVTCNWCIGFWVGLVGATVSVTVAPVAGLWWPIAVVAVALAYSFAVAVLLSLAELIQTTKDRHGTA